MLCVSIGVGSVDGRLVGEQKCCLVETDAVGVGLWTVCLSGSGCAVLLRLSLCRKRERGVVGGSDVQQQYRWSVG